MFNIQWINDLIIWVWQTSIKASIMVVLILSVQWLLRKRISPNWMHLLWLLLILRLLLPGHFESRFSLYNVMKLSPKPNSAIAEKASPVQSAPAVHAEEVAAVQTDPTGMTISHPVWQRRLAIGWMIGAICLTLYTFMTNITFMLRLKNKKIVNSGQLNQCFLRCKKRMKVRARIKLYHVPRLPAPMLFGIFQPKILIPDHKKNLLSREEWTHIFCHELAHYKRQDICISHLTALLQILHWFNPLLWIAFYKLRMDREMACDALVLKILKDEVKAYGQTLIRLLELFSSEQFRPLTVGIFENKRALRQRLQNIMRPRKQTLIWTLITLFIAATLGCALLTEARKKPDYKKTILLEVSPKGHMLHSTRYALEKNENGTDTFTADTLWISNYQLRTDTTQYLRLFGINVKGIMIDSLTWQLTADTLKIDTLSSAERFIDKFAYNSGQYSALRRNKTTLLCTGNFKMVTESGATIACKRILQIQPNRFRNSRIQGETRVDGVYLTVLGLHRHEIEYNAHTIRLFQDSKKIELSGNAMIQTDSVKISAERIIVQFMKAHLFNEEPTVSSVQQIEFTPDKNLSAPGYSNPRWLGFVQIYPDSLILDEVITGPQIIQLVNLPDHPMTIIPPDGKKWTVTGDSETGIRIIPGPDFKSKKLSGRLIPFDENGKYGYKDQDNRVVVRPVLEKTEYFPEQWSELEAGSQLDEHKAGFKCFGKWGYINSDGAVIIPPVYDEVRPFLHRMAAVQIQGKWQYINEKGDRVIDRTFQQAENFYEERAFVQLDNQWGIIDTEGRFIAEPKFERPSMFVEGLAAVQQNGKTGYISRSGELAIPFCFDESYLFQDGLAKTKLNGLYGFINKEGVFVIPPSYEDVNDFSEGLSGVKIGHKYGFMDRTGKVVIQPVYDAILMGFMNGQAKVVQFEDPENDIPGKLVTIDKNGKEIGVNK
jgi:bla regulator protein BlaR1